jgi:outer membrane receptor for ferrienterochelin and colicins
MAVRVGCLQMLQPTAGMRRRPAKALPMGAVVAMSFLSGHGSAQQAPADKPAAPVERVEIKGALDAQRAQSSVMRTVVTREELTKYADPTLAEALRRIPGITINASATGGLEIRMRGLGGGYTQILVNGEPEARGFTWESLSPDLIERIEIVRAASADASNQAVAGSINIILRRSSRPGQVEAKVTASVYEGLGSSVLFGQSAYKTGDTTFSLGVNLSLERDRWHSFGPGLAIDASGAVLHERQSQGTEDARHFTTALTPRMVWKPDETRMLSVDGIFQTQDFEYGSSADIRTLRGAPPDFPLALQHNNTDWRHARVSVNWKAPVWSSSQFELQSTASTNVRDLNGNFAGNSSAGESILERHIDNHVSDRNFSVLGKLSISLLKDHSLKLGFDAVNQRRLERRQQQETSPVGHPTLNLDETYISSIGRLAVFAQDEWQVSPAHALYLGLRTETVRTRTSGAELGSVNNRLSVLSPVAQWLWNLNEKETDQVRLALSRTYKPPLRRQLIPLRRTVSNNTATTPFVQGNPDLRPELAWGLDLGFEKSLPKDGGLSVSAYVRRIDDVILQKVFLSGETWISTPVNSGLAHVSGLETEVRFNAQSLFAAAPNIDMRAGLARNISRVNDVPGPGNRLARQPSLTANLGFDWRPTGVPLTLGASQSYERGDFFRDSVTTSGRTATKNSLTLQAVWSIDKSTRLRMSWNNVMARSETSVVSYTDANFAEDETTVLRQFRVLRIQLDTKF